MSASALPGSVVALNELLSARRGEDHRLRRALGLSYALHAAGLVTLALAGGRIAAEPSIQVFGEGELVNVAPLYSPAAPPGPKPKPAVIPPVRAPEPEPVREVEPAEPEPEPDAIREHKPERRPAATPAPRRSVPPPPPPAPTAKSTAEPSPARHLGGGSVPAARGGPGSPLGMIGGHPDGGLKTLIFSNQWYVMRVQSIIYGYWANPFVGQARPPSPFAVTVAFRILSDGRVVEAAVVESSGNPAWDRSGLRAVENAKLPPLPRDYSRPSVLVSYTFDYDPSR